MAVYSYGSIVDPQKTCELAQEQMNRWLNCNDEELCLAEQEAAGYSFEQRAQPQTMQDLLISSAMIEYKARLCLSLLGVVTRGYEGATYSYPQRSLIMQRVQKSAERWQTLMSQAVQFRRETKVPLNTVDLSLKMGDYVIRWLEGAREEWENDLFKTSSLSWSVNALYGPTPAQLKEREFVKWVEGDRHEVTVSLVVSVTEALLEEMAESIPGKQLEEICQSWQRVKERVEDFKWQINRERRGLPKNTFFNWSR